MDFADGSRRDGYRQREVVPLQRPRRLYEPVWGQVRRCSRAQSSTDLWSDDESPVSRRVVYHSNSGDIPVEKTDYSTFAVVVERLVRSAVLVDTVPVLPDCCRTSVDHRQPG